MSGQAWQVSFPPFYTLQKNEETRKKQLDAWSSLVIEHSRKTSTSTIDLSEIRRSVLFTNSKIERQASIELVEAVFSQLVQKGNAIWKDKSKSKCLLSSQTFSSLAAALYNWAQMSGHINQVCTIFELSQGEEISGEIFQNVPEEIIIIALKLLQKERKAELIGTDGVKFF
ncbi:Oidioi.mRNA.OKI2018_I69.chr2.g5868.t1.cds [Oikopleura dioica]|uniref:Vacuolar protein-sorting-associated protein 25 n=1 Tax=Oikopleura dioica TaxID=34765 RepID=A0ABN7T884_OIKDI|nr:Oidioi.mRNA.OKI2018_I69.chr2.g5868.t1.cds [Oikopleura dioica]